MLCHSNMELPRNIQSCEVFALRKASEKAVSPLPRLTDNFGVVQGLNKGQAYCTSDKSPNAEECEKIYTALRRTEEGRLRKQLVVRHVTAG